jgi:hypothetical protein
MTGSRISWHPLRPLALLLFCGGAANAAPEAYGVHLGPVARTNINRFTAVGRGTAGAILEGHKLSISGKFGGMVSPATDAHLCVSQGIGLPGVCGPELEVSKAMNGTLTGSVTLNARQLAALPAGQLYVQINSLNSPAPGGNLWGWLLPAHEDVDDDVPQQGHWFLPQYDMPKSVEHGSTHEIAEPKS